MGGMRGEGKGKGFLKRDAKERPSKWLGRDALLRSRAEI